MVPGWVLNLEDYARWVVGRLDQLGALVVPEPLVALDLPIREGLGGGYAIGLDVPQHLVTFADGLQYTFAFTVYESRTWDDQLEDIALDTYSFGLRQPDGTWVWRYDRHSGDHHKLGQLSHVHQGPLELVCAAPDVDLEDTLRLIQNERDSGVYDSFLS